MANRTAKDAISIKGTNPQYLVEKITRSRIYESRFWKEECFAISAELLVDKVMELKSIGGVYGGNVKPTPFLCLILKMLQIQPEKDIIVEFIRNEDYKYVRAIGAMYMRLTGSAGDVYKYLEPLYIDYRKMKRMNKSAKYELTHMDEFIDELLHSERVCDVSLPRLQKRTVLEDLNEIETRISPLDVNLDEIETSSEEEEEEEENEEEEAKESSSDEEREKRRRRETRERSHRRSEGEVEDKKRHRSSRDRRSRTRSRSRDRGKKSSSDHKSSNSSSGKKHKFVDLDNPNPQDEIKRFKRSPSPKSDKKKRRSKSRERSDKHHHSSSHRRHKSRDRSSSKGRDRPKEKKHDK